MRIAERISRSAAVLSSLCILVYCIIACIRRRVERSSPIDRPERNARVASTVVTLPVYVICKARIMRSLSRDRVHTLQKGYVRF